MLVAPVRGAFLQGPRPGWLMLPSVDHEVSDVTRWPSVDVTGWPSVRVGEPGRPPIPTAHRGGRHGRSDYKMSEVHPMGWAPTWVGVSDGLAAPATSITSIARYPQHLDVFWECREPRLL